jgi:hypothetical protein
LTNLFNPDRWGVPSDAVEQLADDLDAFWQRYRPCFRTRTRDTSDCARTFWRGQLTMEDQRNFANMDRRLNRRDGQPLQHFMSESPWRAQAVFQQIQRDMCDEPALQTGGLACFSHLRNRIPQWQIESQTSGHPCVTPID